MGKMDRSGATRGVVLGEVRDGEREEWGGWGGGGGGEHYAMGRGGGG